MPAIGIDRTAGWELDANRPWVSRFSDQAVLKFLGRRMPRAGATATITFTGPGSGVAFRFAIPGKGDIEMIRTHLPLAPLEQEVHFRWFADRRIPRLLVSYVVGNWIAQWRQDVQIWESKIYRATPALSSADGPIFRMRQWYQQFLPAENARPGTTGSTLNRGQQGEVGVGGFDGRAVADRAGGNDYVRRRYGDAPCPCLAREFVGRLPGLLVNGQVGQGFREVPKHLPFPLATGTVPELELDHRAPAGLAACERGFDAGTDDWIAIPTE